MKARTKAVPAKTIPDEIQSLIATLLATEQRLEDLTGGEVDTVTGKDGRTFVLRRSQDQLRQTHLSRQVAAAQKLERQQNELRGLFDLVPAMIWFKDTENRMLRVNQRVADSLGTSVEAMEGRRIEEFYPEEAAQYYAADREVMQSGAPKLGIIETVPDRTGAKIWVETDKVPVLDAQGKVTGIIVMSQDITARLRTDENLRRLAAIVEHSADGIVSRTLDGLVTSWNPAAERIFGYSAAEVVGQPLDVLVPPERSGEEAEILSGFRIGEKVRMYETERIRKGGERIAVSFTLSPIKDADGQIVGVSQIARDITGRRAAEAAFRDLAEKTERRERMLTTTLSALTDFTYIFDRDGCFLFANQPLLRLWGRTLEEVVGKNFFALGYPRPLAERLHRQVQQVFRSGESVTDETIYTSSAGLKGCYEYIFSPAFAQDGTVDFVVGATREITERKRMEDALRSSQKIFQSLFEQAAVGVARSEVATGRFVQVNQRYCEIVGRDQAEMLQVTFQEITHPDDLGREVEARRALQAGLVREFTREKRYLRKDGTSVWVSLTVSAMWAPGDPPDFYIAVAQDVSERKRLEEQFRQAQKMDAIGTLAGGIAHDFNNILGAIVGYTDLARMALPGNTKVLTYLAAVAQAASRATALVRQILTFSRQQPLERKPVQLLSIVTETLQLLRASIPSTIEFETLLPTAPPTILADETQIHQILMNLGTNAWHAMKDRPGRLAVTIERWEIAPGRVPAQTHLRPGIYARVSVSDTGSGMDAPTLHRIFEPFFSTKPLGEGTGLGLAVVHGIMETHEGAITVESRLGEGTVFRLYFPAQTGVVAPGAPETEATPRGGGERILFVDDEELLGRLGQLTLAELGYAVEYTTDAQAAIDLVRADPARFDLVITDQTMPRITGLSLAAELHHIRPELPVILTTGYSQSLAPEKVEAAGVTKILYKPVEVRDLGNAVREALGSRLPR